MTFYHLRCVYALWDSSVEQCKQYVKPTLYITEKQILVFKENFRRIYFTIKEC